MMLRRGSDPDVVLRQGPPFFLQTLFQTPILSGNLEIARNHCPAGRKSVYLGRVLGGAADFAALKNSSPSTIDGMKTSNARSRLDTTVSSPSSKTMTILVSSRNLPVSGVNSFAQLIDRLHHLLSGKGVE